MKTIKSLIKTLLTNDFTIAMLTLVICLSFTLWAVVGVNVFFNSLLLEVFTGLTMFVICAITFVCLIVDYQKQDYKDFVSVTDYV